jgi:hypothetical protein
VVGGGLTGGGANWRFKLPLDLEETIPNSAALPRMVIRLPHNAIEEVRAPTWPARRALSSLQPPRRPEWLSERATPDRVVV